LDDSDSLWRILSPVIVAGETNALPRDMSRQTALAYWTAPGRQVFVAEADGVVLGTSYLVANQLGGGAHVANAGYVTAVEARGRDVARALCAHSLAQARACGFRAMQFNFVVSTNEVAVRLWQDMGFAVVGCVPDAFAHPVLGDVDVFVMYRAL
jgi:GNAT superfamily N-acetyltransferase